MKRKRGERRTRAVEGQGLGWETERNSGLKKAEGRRVLGTGMKKKRKENDDKGERKT